MPELGHSISRVSLPVHCVSSMKMGPSPRPNDAVVVATAPVIIIISEARERVLIIVVLPFGE